MIFEEKYFPRYILLTDLIDQGQGQGFIQALLSATVFSLRLSYLISAGGAGAVSPPNGI